MLRTLASALLGLAALAAPASAQDAPVVNASTPEPECRAQVNYDRNEALPGYVGAGGVCHPFMPTDQLAPEGYRGDFYADRFTDARIRERWEA